MYPLEKMSFYPNDWFDQRSSSKKAYLKDLVKNIGTEGLQIMDRIFKVIIISLEFFHVTQISLEFSLNSPTPAARTAKQILQPYNPLHLLRKHQTW